MIFKYLSYLVLLFARAKDKVNCLERLLLLLETINIKIINVIRDNVVISW